MTIQELRKLGEEATAGPWRWHQYTPFEGHRDSFLIAPKDSPRQCVALLRETFTPSDGSGLLTDADAAFIATARNNWELLLDVVEKARETYDAAAAYEAEAKERRVWVERDPDGIIVRGIQERLGPALNALETTK